MNHKPKVSVIMITYNQELYIKEAIQGVLVQKIAFDIELIVADDCSTDQTETVVWEIINTHPQGKIIKYTRHAKNKGMMHNFMWALEQCSGNYIALCEGDDYWTDPYKLQKQVDFLEANLDYVLCYHPVYELNGDIKKEVIRMPNEPSEYDTASSMAMYGNYIYTPSVVFRNITFTISQELAKAPAIDWYIYLSLASYGKYGKLTDTMATYRLNTGVWSQLDNKKRLIQFFVTMYLYYRTLENQPDIQQILKQRYTSLFRTIIPKINEQELNYINQSCTDKSELQQMMLAEIKHLHKSQVSNTKLLSLLKHLLHRIFRTIFIKLPGRFTAN
jgi:glycosyltransferase involved in cell wall biosynthesis